MDFIGDYVVEFKRGKDKKPRKRRGGVAGAIAGGATAGTGAGLIVRRALNNRMESGYLQAGEPSATVKRLGFGKNMRRELKEQMPGAYRASLNESRIDSLKGAKGIASRIKSRPVLAGAVAGAGLGVGAYGAYRLAAKKRRSKR